MKGNISYFAGLDIERNAMVNVSEWDSLFSAKQMETFLPMLDLPRQIVELGVRFERPIINFSHIWAKEKE
ncbi:MAG: hypothetical protein OK457_06380 [Thaumarchaeota archaeon]|nr:hypothetical protein [Nitrososphaerota archaeon]